MTAKIYLSVVDPDKDDSILAIGASDGLLARGDDDENLACGACKRVIARHVSTRTLYDRFAAPSRLVAKCVCGAYNVFPAKVMPEVDGTT